MSIKNWLNPNSLILFFSSLFNSIFFFSQDFNLTSQPALYFLGEWIPSVCMTFLLASTVYMIYFNVCLPGASRMPFLSVSLPLIYEFSWRVQSFPPGCQSIYTKLFSLWVSPPFIFGSEIALQHLLIFQNVFLKSQLFICCRWGKPGTSLTRPGSEREIGSECIDSLKHTCFFFPLMCPWIEANLLSVVQCTLLSKLF